jgi:hypothetical protein
VSATIEFVAVFRVDPIWKYQASLVDPVPASVNVPVICADEPYLYVPGTRLMPPRSPLRTVAPLNAATVLYAVFASFSCEISPVDIVSPGKSCPGCNPVTEVPAVPTLPYIVVVVPVLDTLLKLRTANEAAVPKSI